MSITTYAELQSAVGDWLNRDDLSPVVTSFISLAEARINRDLRHRQQETRSALTVGARYVDLPADWLETIRIQIDANIIDT